MCIGYSTLKPLFRSTWQIESKNNTLKQITHSFLKQLFQIKKSTENLFFSRNKQVAPVNVKERTDVAWLEAMVSCDDLNRLYRELSSSAYDNALLFKLINSQVNSVNARLPPADLKLKFDSLAGITVIDARTGQIVENQH